MSPTYSGVVLYQHLSDFISDYYGPLNDFMYRTSGFLPNKRTPVDLGDSFLAKIYLVEGNMAIGELARETLSWIRMRILRVRIGVLITPERVATLLQTSAMGA